MAITTLRIHRQAQGDERGIANRRKKKAISAPLNYGYVSIDDMDQSKTDIPHFAKVPKVVDGCSLISVHVVGALIFNKTFQTKVCFTHINIRSDSNLIITILQCIFVAWDGPLPPVLYL